MSLVRLSLAYILTIHNLAQVRLESVTPAGESWSVEKTGGQRCVYIYSSQIPHSVTLLVPGAYERREGASNYRTLFVPSSLESRALNSAENEQHVHTYFVKKPAGSHHHSRQALGNPY